MNKGFRRVLPALLVLLLILGTLPTAAGAAQGKTDPELVGVWQADLVFPAADMGVKAPDTVFRCKFSFQYDGTVTAEWTAVELSAIREYFHTIFVNAYYACAFGSGITDYNQVEKFCMDSTGKNVSDYMYSFLDSFDMYALFTPPSTSGTYSVTDDGGAIVTTLPIMECQSNPTTPNAYQVQGNTLRLKADSYGKPDYTFVGTLLSRPEPPEPVPVPTRPDDGIIPDEDEGEIDFGQSLETQYEQIAINLINEIRKNNGLNPLIYDNALGDVARKKSDDMADNRYFSHTSPTYGSPFAMITAFGIPYRSAAENIARGYSSPQEVVDAWMASQAHRESILTAKYTHIGMGFSANGSYWTQLFIQK